MDSNIKMFLVFFIGGILLDLIIYKHSSQIAIRIMRIFKFGWANNKNYSFKASTRFGNFILGNKGENATVDSKTIEIPKELQPAVDAIVQSRIAREREKFTDYEDLKKFKTEHERAIEQKTQEELIKQKKYEEAEKTYKTKIDEYGNIVSKKDQEIQDLKITHHLSNEISKNNGFIEESIAMLRGSAILDAQGNVKIKSKDANGMDVEMPLTEGVKKFYEQRPHLVKSTHKSGAGTGAGDGGGTGVGAGSGQGADHNTLNAELAKAMNRGDMKSVKEIKGKLNALLTGKGVSL